MSSRSIPFHSIWFGLLLLSGAAPTTLESSEPQGARITKLFHYDKCIELTNKTTRVVLCPQVGGRVLVYALNGKNSLYVSEEEQNYKPGSTARPPSSAGRFDIGPEMIIPRRTKLWSGKWKGEIVGDRHARLTSQKDEATGVQLIREFKLDANSSRLSCKQTIVNVSDRMTNWCHWSRTFALGNGICVIPLSERSKFPSGYVMYHPMGLINIRPNDPNIRTKGRFLEITGVPQFPKLGMDSQVGWFAYLMRNDMMFVKSYKTFPERVYNEVAGLTISIWYPKDRRVELEPIGPRQTLKPGQSGSFTEVWHLVPYKFPTAPKEVDSESVAKVAEKTIGQ